ncbi:MAG: NMD3-related protein [Saccharolobus sp.]|jgi:nonsense-mediated mRNA decay protein 3|uniref:60S ribosomal export protein NMD3 n=1 Tax=Saccharolobus sp. TaxID=2100761 RepID=UPI0028CDC55C|nr:NMD3-related protein [Saccharolobus sp.]MDT7860654.1 NMD3-related protein [Saccharolobus sp.]
MGKRFCVVCGKENVELIGSMCVDCYIKNKQLVSIPRKISGKYCKICGAQWIGGKWVRNTNSSPVSAVEEIILRELPNKIKLDENITEFNFNIKNIWKDQGGHIFSTVQFRGKIKDKEFTQEAIINLDVEKAICDHCFRKKTRYYEAIIQLRSKGKEGVDDRKRAFFESFFSRDIIDNLSDIVEGKEGIDYYFINKSVARKLVSNISSIVDVEINESYQNERMKNGKREAKLVISLRI